MLFGKFIEKAYRSRLFVRYDDNGMVYYFSYKDFPGLNAEPYTFKSSHGHELRGYFYSYEGFDTSRIIVFDHGLGAGHRPYMKEIEILCRAGYRVFTYDHTGCMESGGEFAGGFAQSLCDLDDCLKTLKADKSIPTEDISVVGHSWGGYSTMNITAFHPDVKRLVAISGPVSVEKMLEQIFVGLLKFYRKDIFALEAAQNPDYVGCDAITTLRNTKAQALLIYSEDDPTVLKKSHYDLLYSALKERRNVKLLLEQGKRHNPNYTADAASYLATLTPAMLKAGKLTEDEEKKKFRDSFDWNRMTAQDDAVWEKILEHLK